MRRRVRVRTSLSCLWRNRTNVRVISVRNFATALFFVVETNQGERERILYHNNEKRNVKDTNSLTHARTHAQRERYTQREKEREKTRERGRKREIVLICSEANFGNQFCL